MDTAELRAELAELAQEVDPFIGDVDAVHRHVTRRRMATAVVAAVVAVGALGGIGVLAHSGRKHIHVARSAKDVTLAELRAFDAAVVLPDGATADDATRVQAVLDNTPAVAQYTPLPAGTLAYDLLFHRTPDVAKLRTRVCANPSTMSFAVTLAHAVPDAMHELAAAVGIDATVQEFQSDVPDLEVFLKVQASTADTAALRARVESDPDVISVKFLDHNAAFEEFKKLFADQPLLIENETPAGLPESFQLNVRDGVPLESVASRLRDLVGVNQVITRSTDFWRTQPSAPAGDPELFMQVKATDAQIGAVTERLKADARVDSYKFISQMDAYREYVKLFREQPDAIENQTPIDPPTSFQVVLRSRDDRSAFVREYEGLDGVKQVRISDGGFTDACARK